MQAQSPDHALGRDLVVLVEPQADLARVRRRLAVRRVVQLQGERRALLQQAAGVRRLELRLRAGNVRRDARCVRIDATEVDALVLRRVRRDQRVQRVMQHRAIARDVLARAHPAVAVQAFDRHVDADVVEHARRRNLLRRNLDDQVRLAVGPLGRRPLSCVSGSTAPSLAAPASIQCTQLLLLVAASA